MNYRGKWIDPEEHEFKGHENFPSINIAQTVEDLIADRGVNEAAAHAATIARAARTMRREETAEDWDEVYKLIIAQRGV